MYGEVQGIDASCYDVSRFAKFSYDNVGNIIDADFSELEVFLEKHFIPTFIKKTNVNVDGEECDFWHIKIVDLLKIKLSEIEFKYTMEYLNWLGIEVRGNNSSLCKEFANYKFIKRREKYKEGKYEQYKNNSELTSKVKEYFITKDMDLRNEIILKCRNFVECLVKKTAGSMRLNYEELLSYGYEGLIMAIENFDPNQHVGFLSYALIVIKNRLLKGLSEVFNYTTLSNFYFKFITIKKQVFN